MKRQWLIPFLPAAVLAYLLMCAMVDAPGCCHSPPEPFVFVPWHPWIALGVAATALTVLPSSWPSSDAAPPALRSNQSGTPCAMRLPNDDPQALSKGPVHERKAMTREELDEQQRIHNEILDVLRDCPMPAYSSLAMSRLVDVVEKAIKRRLAGPALIACDNCPFWKHVHYDDGGGKLIAPGCDGFAEKMAASP